MNAANKEQPATIAALSGARAIPPLLIVLYHFSEGHHYSGVALIDLIATRGYLWVEFFFALSGFILTHVYFARRAQLWRRAGYLGFLRARLMRLYPLHLFMLLVLVLLVAGARAAAQAHGYVSIYDMRYHPMVDAKGFVLSLLLIQGWNTLNYLTWNGVAWFVSVELALCLVFPLVLRLADGGWARGLLLIAAGIAGLLALTATSRHGLDLTFHNGVLRGLSDFAVGAGMATLYRALKPQGDALPAWLHGALQMMLVATLLLAFTHTGWSHTRLDILTVLPMQALILALAFDRGIVAAALKTRVPQHIGDWSYAIYLGQTVWLQFLHIAEQHLYPAPDTPVLGMRFSTLAWGLEPVVLILVCLGWGALLAEYVEKPAAAALRRRLDRPRVAAPSSGLS